MKAETQRKIARLAYNAYESPVDAFNSLKEEQPELTWFYFKEGWNQAAIENAGFIHKPPTLESITRELADLRARVTALETATSNNIYDVKTIG